MTGINVRAEAAIGCVRTGQLDGPLALSLVVWPPDSLVDEALPQVRRREWPQEIREQAQALTDAGWSRAVVGELLNISPCTIKTWTRRPGRSGSDRRKYDRSLVA